MTLCELFDILSVLFLWLFCTPSLAPTIEPDSLVNMNCAELRGVNIVWGTKGGDILKVGTVNKLCTKS